MIQKLQTKKDGWTVEKIVFPKGYHPSSVKWRNKDGIFQTYIEYPVREGASEEDFPGVDEAKIKMLRNKRTLTGWMTMEKPAYQYDVDLATSS